jgi:hypothetical protein
MADLQEKGYNKEEEYFYKQNKELIEKRRHELDAKRKEQQQQGHPHWMKCPKCGADMKEIERQGIKVDQRVRWDLLRPRRTRTALGSQRAEGLSGRPQITV